MTTYPTGTIAVIFSAQRTAIDDAGYDKSAAAMSKLASKQPGYLGQESSRSPDGFGITVSYWRDDAAAKAWRDNAEHAAIREQGRSVWYESYDLHVARIERDYDWKK